MSDITAPTQMGQITSLIEAGQLPVERDPSGESLSQWSPTTRADDDRAVRTVPKQKPKPLDVESLAKEDMSPIAIGLLQVQPVVIPDAVNAHGNALVARIEALQQEGFELLDLAEKAEAAGDWGVVAAAKVKAAEVWGSAAPLRQELATMAQHVQAALQLNDVISFQRTLLARHPWAASRRELDRCISWASKEYGATEAEILASHPQDLLAGAAAYEQAMKSQGKKLDRQSAADRANTANAKAKADKLRAKNNGRLTVEQQRTLVGEMLRGIEI